MGLIQLLKGNRIYLDANIWIYALENVAEYSVSLTALFKAAQMYSLTIVTSELTLAEILVRSIRDGDIPKQTAYIEAITATSNTTALPVSRSILLEAARVRVSTKLKLPDAIHAATALSTGCTTFLTNDK
ncbi:PIN domain-containing protein [cf. Phormidesmis sp. LEGE 11477]|uniref:type II toxin-antitoxin system VapC family toxin n=1 Tax=cf. Phormidesmis sp. LEGE 11477 TaxID=1828680 RepID=UPI0018806E52|nr:PIN domain-containing protein [cf. Phormidesmis sp. LEGE 11477]MBE9061213.1 PIN domain-containing protein [cf. Phormidesmis sp. LEGE 11477]